MQHSDVPVVCSSPLLGCICPLFWGAFVLCSDGMLEPVARSSQLSQHTTGACAVLIIIRLLVLPSHNSATLPL